MAQPSAVAVLTIFKTGVDIFKTGFGIVNVLRQQSSGSVEDIRNQLEEVRQSMERLITSSTTAIIQEITLQNKLDRIETIVKELHSLLIDLKNIVLAENDIDRENYKNLFRDRFDQRVVAMIRELPGLLSYTIPGLSEPLVDLIREKSNCNMTAIHQFQLFYADLLSDGASLQLAFRELSTITSADVEIFWKDKLSWIQSQFDHMESTCKERLPQYASGEVKQNIDADAMYKICKERYTWAFCDIFYYPPMGTHQFHYHKSVPDIMFWNKKASSGRNQIMIIDAPGKTDKKWDSKIMSGALASNKGAFQSVISGSEDKSAALKVGQAVEEFIKTKGFKIKAMVVFFDATALGVTERKVDQESTGAYVSLEGVTLKYCYSSGFACTFSRWSFFNFNDDWKDYTGTLHVYAYPCLSTSDCEKHSTSGSTYLVGNCLIIGLLALGLSFWLCA